MKRVGKILAVVAMVASLGVFAEEPPPRKEAILETGPGGLRLTVSVPDYAEGPYDLARNKGPLILNQRDLNRVLGEVMFDLAIGKSARLVYQVTATRRFTLAFDADRVTAEGLAEEQIKRAGFEGRAVSLGCPPISILDSTIVCYRMTGDRIMEGKSAEEKYAHVLIAISFDHDKQGYALMASISESDVARFAADPARYEKIATNALGDLWRNHKIEVR